MLGGYVGVTGDGRAVPNFYELYSRRRGKPMVVPETAAMFNAAAKDGADKKLELSLKSAWFRQVSFGGSRLRLQSAAYHAHVRHIMTSEVAHHWLVT
jgi:hypothetical protein